MEIRMAITRALAGILSLLFGALPAYSRSTSGCRSDCVKAWNACLGQCGSTKAALPTTLRAAKTEQDQWLREQHVRALARNLPGRLPQRQAALVKLRDWARALRPVSHSRAELSPM